MGAGANAEKIAVLPVIHVMPRLTAGLRVGGYFILRVTTGGHALLPGFLYRPENIFLG